MTHKHSVRDTGAHFMIDPYSRQIKNDSANKTTIVQYDHNSERLTFEMPLQIDGHAMTLCDLIEIHYINIATDGNSQNTGVYEVNDIKKAEGEKAVFTWLIRQEATQLAGSLNFFIVFKCTENGKTVYRWGTEICKSLAVSAGMDNGEAALTEYPDILAQWKAELFEAGGNAVVNVNEAATNALAAIEEAGEAKKEAVLASIPDDYTALSVLADSNYRNKAGTIVLEAEGESVVLSDSSPYPLQGLKLFGKSTQDGTPTPESPVEIVSVGNPAVTVYGKNLINNTLSTSSNGGITYTTNADGSITINGTATNESYYKFDFQNKIPIKGVVLVLSIKGGAGKTSITVGYFDKSGNVTNSIAYTDNNEKLFAYPDEAEQTRTFLTVPAGTVCDNVVVYPMVRVASIDDNTYELPTKQTLSTSHALHGIPVASGGNYTDENGQRWICDEIDLARGVYVQRVANITLDGSEAWGVSDNEFYCSVSAYSTSDGEAVQCICTHYPAESRFEISRNTSTVGYAGISIRDNYIRLVDNANCNGDIDALKMLLAEQASTENFVELRYVLATPIETPLSEAEIAAFKALHTNKPNTTILNDAGAHMAVSYVADTKLYIDNKIKEIMEGVTE